MRLLKSTRHPDIDLSGNAFYRRATRAIVLRGNDILMLYTKRSHDYTLPGGGVDEGEDLIQGLMRELSEETGAKDIVNIRPFGCYEEFRPWHKDGFDLVHMQSFCYTCDIESALGETRLEAHEINNGMHPMWINIHSAIEHNRLTMKESQHKGLSIERETFLLELIVKELLE